MGLETVPAIAAPWAATAAWRRRVFDGLTGHRIATISGLCGAWAVTNHIQDWIEAWQHGLVVDWLVRQVGAEFVATVAIAIVLATPLVIVGNLGPQAGWRRYAALAATIALSAPMAGVVRLVYLALTEAPVPLDVPPRVALVLWFRYVQLATLVTAVVEFNRHEQRSIESMHRAEIDRLALDREMGEARLQVLQAQIEPHFLFNTLANVRRLYQTDLAGGRKMLQHLMRYLEVALPHMRQDRSTLRRELTLIESYLSVQHIRMGQRLSFAIDVPEALNELELPPMMLLTLVENAIKHGLNPLPEGGAIKVLARLEGADLRIDVADSGRGFHATSGGGTGLANIRARLEATHGQAASLTLVEGLPRGVTSILRLPILPAEMRP